jgi:predicted regulator of Ras-like GTPase activity (Roadblock/LC7/MglB family)
VTSIQDLVRALRARNGVEAVVLLGRDGLVIESQAAETADAERLAAIVPLVVGAVDELGRQASRGAVATVVVEYETGAAIISPMGSDAVLLVLASMQEIGPLLHELRRNRGRLATLV